MNTWRRIKTTLARAAPCRWCKKKPTPDKPDTPDTNGGNMKGSRALLVGINAYPQAPLRGCVNDINAMAEFLVEKRKFEEENVRLLVDGRATTQAILERMEWLCQAKPGEQVFFHYSGHGVQVPTRNDAGEVDDLLEAICPVDFNWSDSRMITDKTFVKVFKKMPAGVFFNWLSDSCHSGDLDRNMPPKDCKPRLYPVPADMAWRQRVAKNKQMKRAMVGGLLDVGFMSGCRSDQTSADAYIQGDYWGAFTFHFLKAVKEAPDLPMTELRNKVCGYLEAGGYTQRPEAEGARRTLPFLSKDPTPGG